MFIQNSKTISLKPILQYKFCFKVIFKDIRDPDDTYISMMCRHEWVNTFISNL